MFNIDYGGFLGQVQAESLINYNYLAAEGNL